MARQTKNYGLFLADGTDKVNPLTQYNPASEKIDEQLKKNADASLVSATETYVGVNHAIIRSNKDADAFRFKATSNFNIGDTFTVDGVSVTAVSSSGETLPENAFKIGNAVIGVIDDTILTLFFMKQKDSVSFAENANHANSADSATTANSATTADSATTATNSSNAGFLAFQTGRPTMCNINASQTLTLTMSGGSIALVFVKNAISNRNCSIFLLSPNGTSRDATLETIYSGTGVTSTNTAIKNGMTITGIAAQIGVMCFGASFDISIS